MILSTFRLFSAESSFAMEATGLQKAFTLFVALCPASTSLAPARIECLRTDEEHMSVIYYVFDQIYVMCNLIKT